MLGPLEVVDDLGVRCDPAALRQRRLLQALLVGRGEQVSAAGLVELVWADGAMPADPIRTLRTYVARLRNLVEPDRGERPRTIRGEGTGYVLDLSRHTLDADEFVDLLELASSLAQRDPVQALNRVDGALALWRGPALAEVADEPWAAPEAARFDELRLVAGELRIDCLVEVGQVAEAIAELERLVRTHPLRERPHRQLMLALARAGRMADASTVYRTFRETLADEAGLDPTPDLGRLHVRLLSSSETDDATPSASPRHNLVAPRTSFVGREMDLLSLQDLVGSARLITLTGMGGAGKTRLAIELAHRVLPRFPDGVHLVPLAAVTDAEVVAKQVAAAVGVPGGSRIGVEVAGSVAGNLIAQLRSARAMLVLDNAEHLLQSVASFVEKVLDGCPSLSVIVTSREPLGVEGEHLWPVGPLATESRDGSDADALRLLADRTTQLVPTFVITEETRDALEAICRGLDGIPLALELAAGWLAHLSPAEVVGRLDDRLRLLSGGPRRAARQRTLHATIDWSYRLLDPAEQALLRDLASFAAATPIDAIIGICRVAPGGRPLVEVIGSLTAKSLVVAEPTGETTRYRLLESVRLYAEQASREAEEWDELQDRHRMWLVEWLEAGSWDHRLCSPLLARQADERHDDLRRSLERSRTQQRWDLLARQLLAMSGLFSVQGHLSEGRRWHALAAAHPVSDPVMRARLEVHRCYLDVWTVLGEMEPYERILDDLQTVVPLLPEGSPEIALAHFAMAGCQCFLTRDAAAVLRHTEQCVDVALAADAPQLAGGGAAMAAGAHLFAADPAGAIEALERIVVGTRWQDDHDGLRVRASLATARYVGGDHAGAVRDAEVALGQLGAAWQQDALGTLALATAAQGDLDAARQVLVGMLDDLAASGWRNWVICSDVAIIAGVLALYEQDLETACRLLAPVRWTSNPLIFVIFVRARRAIEGVMDPELRRITVATARERGLAELLEQERERRATHRPPVSHA